MSQPVLPLEGKRHVLLAVSGGSDSTALLILAVKQAKMLANPPKLTAITIDHAIRAESADEAKMVAGLCARLSVQHFAHRWEGEKPLTGIQDAARDARRGLIAQTAGQIGADLVLTGHTQDDLLETVAMRQKRGPGPGLAGIAPCSYVFNDAAAGGTVLFQRPLLGTSRAGLRTFLESANVAWIDDPSNDNDAFERVVIRRELAASGAERRAELLRIQEEAAIDRVDVSKRAADFILRHARAAAPGLIRLSYEFAQTSRADEAIVALRTLLAFAAGAPLMAAKPHARTILAAARAMSGSGSKPTRHGWGGALADFRRQGLYLMQEQRGGLPGTGPFCGRYRLLGAAPALAPARTPLMDCVPAPASLMRRVNAAEPLFSCPERGSIPASEAARLGLPLRLLLNPWPDLVPSFDLELAAALARLAGAPPLPAPTL